MRRLIWGFAGRIYHIVGNLMSRLIWETIDDIWLLDKQGAEKGILTFLVGAHPLSVQMNLHMHLE